LLHMVYEQSLFVRIYELLYNCRINIPESSKSEQDCEFITKDEFFGYLHQTMYNIEIKEFNYDSPKKNLLRFFTDEIKNS
jgi:hypothetical protein